MLRIYATTAQFNSAKSSLKPTDLVFIKDTKLIYTHEGFYGTTDLSNYVTLNSAQTITGQKTFNTNTNATPLIIARNNSATESLQLGVDDSTIYFNTFQDETRINYKFSAHWTDTESGGGADAGDNYIQFHFGSLFSVPEIRVGAQNYLVYHSGNLTSGLGDYVTLSGDQKISGLKTFDKAIIANAGLNLSVGSTNFISATSNNGSIAFNVNATSKDLANAPLHIISIGVNPGSDNVYSLGASNKRWANIHGTNGYFTGALQLNGAAVATQSWATGKFVTGLTNSGDTISWTINDKSGGAITPNYALLTRSVRSLGATDPLTGRSFPTYAGISMEESKNNPSWPALYGNVLNLKGSSNGSGQLFLEWSSSSTEAKTGNLYYRSIRDVTMDWGPWQKLAFISEIEANYVTLNTAQDITGKKTFKGGVVIDTGKLQFLPKDSSDESPTMYSEVDGAKTTLVFTIADDVNDGYDFRQKQSGGSGNYESLLSITRSGIITPFQIKSTYTGGAPFTVASSGLVTNLNAHYLEGTNKAGLFTSFAASNNNTSITIGGTTKTLQIPYATNAGSLNGKSSDDFVLTFGTNAIISISGSGTHKYFRLAVIEVKATYANYPITFEIIGRALKHSLVSIRFANVNNTDPDLDVFESTNEISFYLKKTATSTWELWGSANDGVWAILKVRQVFSAALTSSFTITLDDKTKATELPADYVLATKALDSLYVTLDTAQSIKGSKTFTSPININNALPLKLLFAGINYIQASNGSGQINFVVAGKATETGNSSLILKGFYVYPGATDTYYLGNLDYRWKTIYGGALNLSGNIVASGNVTASGTSTFGNIKFNSTLEGTRDDGPSYIKSASYLALCPNGQSQNLAGASLYLNGRSVYPGTSEGSSLGIANNRWANIYGVNANLSGTLSGTIANFSGTIRYDGYDRINITGTTTDLNTLNLDDGSADIKRYICYTDGGTSAITNLPSEVAHSFILDVVAIRYNSASDYVTDQYLTTYGYTNLRYTRRKTVSGSTNKWSEWTVVALTDTNTHYTTRLFVGDGSNADKATTNGNTKLTLYDDSTKRDTITLKGTGLTTVTSDASKVITIDSNLYKGNNPISSSTNDTQAYWAGQKSGSWYFSGADQLLSLPHTYGFVLNLTSGSEVHQLWLSQSQGILAHRGANSSGWGGVASDGNPWRVILDSTSYTTYAVSLGTNLTITGSKNFVGNIKLQYLTDTSNAIGLKWVKTDGKTETQSILAHNTANRIIINATGAAETWTDAIGKYSLVIGSDKLTYNTYPILHTANEVTIDGIKRFNQSVWVLTGNEGTTTVTNIITNKFWDNGTLYKYDGSAVLHTNSAIRNALVFKWYEDEWHIGNIRSSGATTSGFSIALKSGSKLLDVFRVDANYIYYKGNKIFHEGNMGSGSGLNADTVDTYHITSDLIYNSSKSINYTGSSVWYVKVVLSKNYINTKERYKILSSYDNILATVYLDLLMHDCSKYALTRTNYNGCNVEGFYATATSGIISFYFKMKAPTGGSGKLEIYGNGLSTIEIISAPKDEFQDIPIGYSEIGTKTIGTNALPVYLNNGRFTTINKEAFFPVITTSGNNISITVAGLSRSVTAPYATNAGNAATADTAKMLKWSDSRGTSTLPNDYNGKFEVKGIKNVNKPSNDSYYTVLGLRGHTDSTGGNAWELGFDNSTIYARTGSTTSWENWKLFAFISDFTTLSSTSTVPLTISLGSNTKTLTTLYATNYLTITAPTDFASTEYNDFSLYINTFVRNKGISVISGATNTSTGADKTPGASIILNVGTSTTRFFRIMSSRPSTIYWQTSNSDGSGWGEVYTLLHSGTKLALSQANTGKLTVSLGNNSATADIYNIASQGKVTAISNHTRPNYTGISMVEAYSNGYPYNYGNVILVKGSGGGGSGQLFLGWTGGTDSVTSNGVWYRSHRDNDNDSFGWATWRRLAYVEELSAYEFYKGAPTTTSSTDTTATWATHKAGLYKVSTTDKVANQPQLYGFILNLSDNLSEMHLLWLNQASGNIYHRGGNKTGWRGSASNSGTWTTLLDTDNYKNLILDNFVTIDTPLSISGKKTFSDTIVAKYNNSSWIGIVDNCGITGSQLQNASSAYSLITLKSYSGHAVAYGGNIDTIGFYGFFKSRIDEATNGTDWKTYWNTATGSLTHTKNLTVDGVTQINNNLTTTGKIRTSNVVSAGESDDNLYGYINITRTNTINNASCFSWIRLGMVAFGLGFDTNNNIVLGRASTDKTLTPWLTIGSGSASFAGTASATLFILGSSKITTNGGYLELLGNNNELVIGGTGGSGMHINYRASSGANTPLSWYLRNGTATGYAEFRAGNLYSNDKLVATQEYVTNNASNILKWEGITKVGSWSKVFTLSKSDAVLYTIYISQNSQATSYTYLISSGYTSPTQSTPEGVSIIQVAGAQYRSNSALLIRAVSTASSVFDIELLNSYGYNGVTEVKYGMSAISLRTNGVTPITTLSVSTAAASSVMESLTSQYDGTVLLRLNVLKEVTLSSNLLFDNNTAGIQINNVKDGLSNRIVKTTGAWIHGGSDAASSTDANLRFSSWYGIGWYNTCSGQTVAQGNNAMWLNVRTGNLYLYGNVYIDNGTNKLLKLTEVDARVSAVGNPLYVSNVALNGNYLRVTKNGSNSDLTIPFATVSTYSNYCRNQETVDRTTYTTVKATKDRLVTIMSSWTTGVGQNVSVKLPVINNWNNDSASVEDSSVYTFIKISGGYAGSTYGLYLLSSYNKSKVGIVGRTNNEWSDIKWFAWEDDVNNKVTKAGDTMTGNLIVSADSATERDIRVQNSNGKIDLICNANGHIGLYDRKNSLWILYKDANGGITIDNSNANGVCIGGMNYSYKLYVNGTLYVANAATLNSTLRVTGTVSTGEASDNSYGFVNVCRTNTIDNAACFSWVRLGTKAFALGFDLSNNIVIGGGVSGKTVDPWLTFSKTSAKFASSSVYAGDNLLLTEAWIKDNSFVRHTETITDWDTPFKDSCKINGIYQVHKGLADNEGGYTATAPPFDYGSILLLNASSSNVQVGFKADTTNKIPSMYLRTRWWSGNTDTTKTSWTNWSEVITTANIAKYADIEYYTGHNTVTTCVNIPTDKRLCIVNVSKSEVLNLKGDSLPDGKEIVIILKINGNGVYTTTISTNSAYKSTIPSLKLGGGNNYCEVNILSDGTNLYVRGI